MEKNKNRSLLYIILFILNPFLVLLALIKDYSKIPNRKTLIVLISGFIGMSFYYTPGSDISGYVIGFEKLNMEFNELLVHFSSLYKEGTGRLDIYIDLLMFTVKLFTPNSKVFIIVLGLIFGYFYANYIEFIVKDIKNKSILTVFFIITFVISLNPQLGINYRFHTAAAILLYSFYKAYLDRKYKYLLLALLSILVHSGMIAFIALIAVIFLIRNKPKIAYILLIVSIGISGVNFSNLSSIFGSMGLGGMGLGGVETKMQIYTSERAYDRYDITYGSDGLWFFKIKARMFFLAVSAVLIYFYYKRIKNISQYTKHFFVAAAVYISFWNIASSFPMIYRYEPMIVVFVSSFFIHINSTYKLDRSEKKIQYFAIPFMVLYVVVAFRIFLGAIPSRFPISSPILESFLAPNSTIF